MTAIKEMDHHNKKTQHCVYYRVKRREFLNLGLLSASSLLIPNSTLLGNILKPYSIAGFNAYLVESGQFRRDGIQCVGILKLEESAISSFSTLIANLRTSTNFYLPLLYRSTNRFKVNFARRVIDAFLSESSVSFHAQIFQRIDHDSNMSRHAFQTLKYDQVNSNFLTGNTGTSGAITTTQQANWGPNQYFENSFQSITSSSLELLPVSNTSNDLLQLASFIIGLVYADNIGYLDREVKNTSKTQLLQYFKDQLGVPKLSPEYLSTHSKLQIIN